VKRQDLLLGKVDPEIKALQDLDHEFYADADDLQGLLEKYMEW
jgi:hypothetical protein